MNNKFRDFNCAVLVSAAAMVMAAPAWAQTTPQAVDEPGLGEIVVTANKREENLQRTPVAITAVSARQLELQGLAETKDLGAIAPNLSIVGATTNATASVVTIRGIPTSTARSTICSSPTAAAIQAHRRLSACVGLRRPTSAIG